MQLQLRQFALDNRVAYVHKIKNASFVATFADFRFCVSPILMWLEFLFSIFDTTMKINLAVLIRMSGQRRDLLLSWTTAWGSSRHETSRSTSFGQRRTVSISSRGPLPIGGYALACTRIDFHQIAVYDCGCTAVCDVGAMSPKKGRGDILFAFTTVYFTGRAGVGGGVLYCGCAIMRAIRYCVIPGKCNVDSLAARYSFFR